MLRNKGLSFVVRQHETVRKMAYDTAGRQGIAVDTTGDSQNDSVAVDTTGDGQIDAITPKDPKRKSDLVKFTSRSSPQHTRRHTTPNLISTSS